MADKKKKKKSNKRAKALKAYLEMAEAYIVHYDAAQAANAEMEKMKPELRRLAKEAGIDKTKEKFQIDEEHIIDVQFKTAEKYDTDRLRAALKEHGLTKVLKACFTKEPVKYKFDKTQFEKLEEAGDIPQEFIELIEDEDDPIYWEEDLTPAVSIVPTDKAKKGKK